MTTISWLLIALGCLAIGCLVGYIVRKKLAEARIKSAEEAAAKILIDAKKESETRKKEALLEAKEEIHRLRSEAERENKERRNEIKHQENRLQKKEEDIDRKMDGIERKEETIHQREKEAEEYLAKAQELQKQKLEELEKVSGLTVAEAKQLLLNSIEDEVKHESAMMVRDIENSAREEGEKRAKEIVASAIQRVAADHCSETTVSVVALPNEEMKGRIIGREGRNIRTDALKKWWKNPARKWSSAFGMKASRQPLIPMFMGCTVSLSNCWAVLNSAPAMARTCLSTV